MKLKAYLISRGSILIALVVLFIPLDAWASDLPSSSDHENSGGLTVDQSAKSYDRAKSLIQYIQEAYEKTDQQSPQNVSYDVSYTEDGYIDQVAYSNGFTINMSYQKDENGNIAAITFKMSIGETSVSIQVNNENKQTSPNADSEPFKGYKVIGQDDLGDPNIQEWLLQLIFKHKVDESTFGQLLSSLKKSRGQLSPSFNSGAIDFSALQHTLDSFKENQEKAFHNYRVQTQVYYDTLASMLKEDLLSLPNSVSAKEESIRKNNDLLSRKQIDQAVSDLMNEKTKRAATPASVTSKITGLQPILSETYITPNREKLQKAIETNISLLQKNLYEMLILQGSTAVIRNHEGSTEILILLPQAD